MAFTSKIPSSQTKVICLWCYRVFLFVHVATQKYGCNLDMKIVVKKLFIVLC